MAERRHFIIHPDRLSGNRFVLNGDEGHHAARVTRLRIGDSITLLDTEGPAYAGVVEKVGGDRIEGRIVEKIEHYHEPSVSIHLGIGMLKGSKLDTVVEKCTELGVSSITVLNLKKSVKRNVNLERLRRLSISAMKQCGRGLMPDISSSGLSRWIGQDSGGEKFVMHEKAESGPLVSHLEAAPTDGLIWLAVGPEGGFSQDELEILEEAGFIQSSIGPRRLRSETAAITSVAIAEQIAERDSRRE